MYKQTSSQHTSSPPRDPSPGSHYLLQSSDKRVPSTRIQSTVAVMEVGGGVPGEPTQRPALTQGYQHQLGWAWTSAALLETTASKSSLLRRFSPTSLLSSNFGRMTAMYPSVDGCYDSKAHLKEFNYEF